MSNFVKNIADLRHAWGARTLVAPFSSEGIVSVEGSVLGGRRFASHHSVAECAAQMLLEGTKKKGKRRIQELLDATGSSVSFSVSNDRLEFAAKMRVEHLGEVLSLIAEALREPVFPAKELAAFKKRAQGALDMQKQDPRTQTSIALSQLLYEPSHPNYAHSTQDERKAVTRLSRDDLAKFHAKTLTGDSLIITYAGDIDAKTASAATQKHFKSLPQLVVVQPPIPPAHASFSAKRTAASIPHKSSIDYMTGMRTGITKQHPDFPALLLGMQILGNPSGFTGRFMRIVREQEGLTYGVYAYLKGFQEGADGYVSSWGTFAPELFEKGRVSMRREIERIVREGATEEEVRKHREQFAARYHVRLSNSSAIAAAMHDAIVEGEEPAYLDTFPERVRRVTRNEVNDALKKYLVPQLLSEAAAGPVDKKLFA